MNDILKIIGQHVQLERQGKNYIGLCPLHSEKTPSFTVDSATQTFRCLGCGAYGDAREFAKLMLEKGLNTVTNVNLHVSPNFTGRVVVQLKEGRHVCDYPQRRSSGIPVLELVVADAGGRIQRTAPRRIRMGEFTHLAQGKLAGKTTGNHKTNKP